MKAREPGFDVENRDSRYDPGKKRAPVDLGIYRNRSVGYTGVKKATAPLKIDHCLSPLPPSLASFQHRIPGHGIRAYGDVSSDALS